jgi:hypothetical protein
MRLLLTITVSALALAGCADDFDKSANTNCARPADKQAQWDLVAPGVVSLGMDMPTKKRLGIANSNQVAMNMTACVHNEDNKENKPQIQDLQKIGASLLFSSKTRL